MNRQEAAEFIQGELCARIQRVYGAPGEGPSPEDVARGQALLLGRIAEPGVSDAELMEKVRIEPYPDDPSLMVLVIPAEWVGPQIVISHVIGGGE